MQNLVLLFLWRAYLCYSQQNLPNLFGTRVTAEWLLLWLLAARLHFAHASARYPVELHIHKEKLVCLSCDSRLSIC